MPSDFWWVILELVVAAFVVWLLALTSKPSDEVRSTTSLIGKRLAVWLASVAIYLLLIVILGTPILAGLSSRHLGPDGDQNRSAMAVQSIAVLLTLGLMEALVWTLVVRRRRTK